MLAFLFQRALGAGHVVRQVVGEESHGIETETMHDEVVAHAYLGDRLLRRSCGRNPAVVEEHDQRAIEQERDARHGEARPPAQQRRGDGDDDQIEQREGAGGPAQVIHQASDQDQIADELDVGLGGGKPPQQPHHRDVEQRRHEGGAGEQQQHVAGHDLGLGRRRRDRGGRLWRCRGRRPHEALLLLSLRRRRSLGGRNYPKLEQEVGEQHADDRHHPDGGVPTELIDQRSHSEEDRGGEATPALDLAVNVTRSWTESSRGAGTWRPRSCR